jgi:hypothetical protein
MDVTDSVLCSVVRFTVIDVEAYIATFTEAEIFWHVTVGSLLCIADKW